MHLVMSIVRVMILNPGKITLTTEWWPFAKMRISNLIEVFWRRKGSHTSIGCSVSEKVAVSSVIVTLKLEQTQFVNYNFNFHFHSEWMKVGKMEKKSESLEWIAYIWPYCTLWIQHWNSIIYKFSCDLR